MGCMYTVRGGREGGNAHTSKHEKEGGREGCKQGDGGLESEG